VKALVLSFSESSKVVELGEVDVARLREGCG
jgi:hypothetical protein